MDEVAPLLHHEPLVIGVDVDSDGPVVAGLHLDTAGRDVNVYLRVAADAEFFLDHSSIVARCLVAPLFVVRV